MNCSPHSYLYRCLLPPRASSSPNSSLLLLNDTHMTFTRKNNNYNYARTNHQNDGNSVELYIALAYNAYFML